MSYKMLSSESDRVIPWTALASSQSKTRQAEKENKVQSGQNVPWV